MIDRVFSILLALDSFDHVQAPPEVLRVLGASNFGLMMAIINDLIFKND
jgi:hypothetical protein